MKPFTTIGATLATASVLALPCSAYRMSPVVSADQADLQILGAHNLDKSGWAFAAGDFNGDGATDLAISSCGASPPGRQGAGIIDILWGGAPRDSVVDLLGLTVGISKTFSPQGMAGLYMTLTSGDFNRDGYDDLVIGLPLQVDFTNSDGRAIVVFGAAAFPDTLDLNAPTLPTTTIYGVPWSDGWLGGFDSAAGDVNGDGYTDIIVSAVGVDPGGHVYVFYGRDSFPPRIYLSLPQPALTRIIDDEYGWGTGSGLACGDVNRDGLSDLLIGSFGNIPIREHGKGTLVYGSPALPDTVLLSDRSIAATRIYSDDSEDGALGYDVALGDIDGDNWLDLILSAPRMSPLGCFQCGTIYAVYGSESLPDSIHVNTDQVDMTRLIGTGDDQCYSWYIVSADLTCDGYDDLAFSSDPEHTDPGDVHKVSILFGSAQPPDSVFMSNDSTVARILGEQRDDLFSEGLNAADINDDGRADLIIGAHRADPLGRYAAGQTYVFLSVKPVTAVKDRRAPGFRLETFPNPFSSSTGVTYELPSTRSIDILIYDVTGRVVTRLFTGVQTIGLHTITWDGRNEHGQRVPSGVYFCRLEAGGSVRTVKTILIR